MKATPIDVKKVVDTISDIAHGKDSTPSGLIPSQVRIANIDSAYSGAPSLPTVMFEGEAANSGKTYQVINPAYKPAANDRVIMMPVGRTYVIAGPVNGIAGTSEVKPGGLYYMERWALSGSQSGPGSANSYQSISWSSTPTDSWTNYGNRMSGTTWNCPYNAPYTLSLDVRYTATSAGQFGLRIWDASAGSLVREIQSSYPTTFGNPSLTVTERMISGHLYTFDVATPVGGKTLAAGTWLTIVKL